MKGTGTGIALLLCSLLACGERELAVSLEVAGGDARRGREALERYGCVSCHVIPGIAGSRSTVGPPLAKLASRVYVAGVVPNLPEPLVRFIVEPSAVAPQTAMPDLDVSVRDARDMAAYLYRDGR